MTALQLCHKNISTSWNTTRYMPQMSSYFIYYICFIKKVNFFITPLHRHMFHLFQNDAFGKTSFLLGITPKYKQKLTDANLYKSVTQQKSTIINLRHLPAHQPSWHPRSRPTEPRHCNIAGPCPCMSVHQQPNTTRQHPRQAHRHHQLI